MYKEQIKIDKKKYKVIEQEDDNGNITIKVIERYDNCELCKVKEKKSKRIQTKKIHCKRSKNVDEKIRRESL